MQSRQSPSSIGSSRSAGTGGCADRSGRSRSADGPAADSGDENEHEHRRHESGVAEVRRGGELIELTRTEFALLELFLTNPRQVLTRSIIFERVWGYDFGFASNSLDVYIGYLRRKTEEGGKPRLIQTVRGVGYALREP